MILLCGIPSEAPLRLVIEAAARMGVEAVLFNQREAQAIQLSYTAWVDQAGLWRVDGGLEIGGQSYPLEAFSGVYVRLMDYQGLPEYRTTVPSQISAENEGNVAELHSALVDWLEAADLRVMNRLGAMGSNQSKPYQAQIIAQAGFLTPPTLITNDPQAVQEFIAEHGRVVYKSISAIRSVVQELKRSQMAELDKIRYLPTQFQAYIPGENIRVHVAGEQVFATRLVTTALDYRYAGREGLDLEMETVYIEEEVADRCRALSKLLGLPLCGIDLKRTPAGEVFCFEANPSPAFSFYQEYTGQDIAAGIVQYLAGSER